MLTVKVNMYLLYSTFLFAFCFQDFPSRRRRRSLSLSLSDRSCCSSFSVCWSFSMVCCRAARSSCHCFRLSLLCFQSSLWKARSPVPVSVSRFPPCRPLFILAAVFQAEERLCPSGLKQPLLRGVFDVCWAALKQPNHPASLVSPWAGQSAALGPCEFCTTGILRKSGPAASAPCRASTDGGSPSPTLQLVQTGSSGWERASLTLLVPIHDAL